MILKECDWEITTRCNLNCKHCLIIRHNEELSTEECFKVIDNLSEAGCKRITFTGGEPLVKKDFFKILEYSHSKKISNWIFTNGTKINKNNITEIKRLVDYIGFSLDGSEKENDAIRGETNFRKTLNAIKLVKKHKIFFGIYLTLTKWNVNSLERNLKYIKNLKPFNVGINELVNRGNARKNKEYLTCKLKREEIIENVKKVYGIKRLTFASKCAIVPKKIVIDPLSNIYGCTEIKQTASNKILGNVLKGNYFQYQKFIKRLPKKKIKSCPYDCYSSDKVNITFLNNKPCSLR